MKRRFSSAAATGFVIAALWACQVGGTVAASEDLAERYGSENVDVALRKDGATVVDVTIADPSFSDLDQAALEARAREIGGIVAAHVELSGEDDEISVALVSGDEAGAVQTTRTSTFRFSPQDLTVR
ncbi:MAG: hypothetical protein H0W36_04175 [Gemmatimonadetes bacterium]|nr:hypothetical protein [Gemmatimonadota bacterium]